MELLMLLQELRMELVPVLHSMEQELLRSIIRYLLQQQHLLLMV